MDGLVPEVVRGVFAVGILGSASRGGWGKYVFLLFFNSRYGGELNTFNPCSVKPVTCMWCWAMENAMI